MSRMQEKIIDNPPAAYVGIDVGKDQLDVFVHPNGSRMTVRNDRRSITSLASKLRSLDAVLVTMEATGRYHRMAHDILHEAGLQVAVINPFRSRQFAESMGRLAKTDTIDAQMLAHFGERMQPSPSVPHTEAMKQLRDLYAARRQVVSEIADLKRKQHSSDNGLVMRQIRSRLAMAERHKSALEGEIGKLIQASADLQDRYNILTSIPNMGRVTATALLAELNELGQVNAKEIAALAGVAPMNWDSGCKNGNRMIRGGRKSVRNALYMCAVTCITRSDPFGHSYRKLIARGKNPKVALTAVMRKMIIVANTLIAEDRPWRDGYAGALVAR